MLIANHSIIRNASCKGDDLFTVFLGNACYSYWCFSHNGLGVEFAFTCYNDVGVFYILFPLFNGTADIRALSKDNYILTTEQTNRRLVPV